MFNFKNQYNALMSAANCNSLACLRNKGVNALANAGNKAMSNAVHPLKAYPSMFSPVVDGVFLKDQLINSVASGRVRKNTPISWNYAEHDGFGFAEQGFEHLTQFLPQFVNLGEEIWNVVDSSGFNVPSDYTDRYLQQLYGENWPQVQPVFGCPNKNNGGRNNCLEKWTDFFTAHTWVCNTRWALTRLLQVKKEYILLTLVFSTF